jgi:hypothetical protein
MRDISYRLPLNQPVEDVKFRNEKSWGLATYLRKRFETLTLHIIDDRISVADAAWLLSNQ